MGSRKSVTYNKVVNFDRESNEITVLNDVFEYEDGMRGATGTVFVPVSEAQYDEETSFDNLKEYIKDCMDRVPENYEDEGWNGFTQAIIDNGEAGDTVYDMSYSYLWDMLREECGLDESDAYVFNCVGGGRCFSSDFEGNMHPELSEIIREYES